MLEAAVQTTDATRDGADDCETRFIDDASEGAKDAFGSHERIARTIHQVIRTPSAS